MYAKEVTWKEKGKVCAELYASAAPVTMPTTTDGIGGVADGYELCPGSSLFITGTGAVYVMGDNQEWSEI